MSDGCKLVKLSYIRFHQNLRIGHTEESTYGLIQIMDHLWINVFEN
jgi:hypothetical protein